MTDAPLRIMQLTSGDLWAGAEVQFFTLCRALRERGDVALRVVVLNEGELATRLREIGAEPVVLDETRLSAPQIFRELLSLLRQWRPQVLHTHRFKENVIGGLAAATLTTLLILPAVFALFMGRASTQSPSLSPTDPESPYYLPESEHAS